MGELFPHGQAEDLLVALRQRAECCHDGTVVLIPEHGVRRVVIGDRSGVPDTSDEPTRPVGATSLVREHVARRRI